MPAVCKIQDLVTSCLSQDFVESHVIRSKTKYSATQITHIWLT